MSSRIKIICGATASGKSARAIDIAKTCGGVIINADAMQIYQELRIVTARPSVQDELEVPHKLYGVISAKEACSVAKWLEMAKIAIDETLANNKLPIVTGGTGLYIKALLEGLSPIPDIPPEVREEATKLWEEQGNQALQERDAIMSERLEEGDKQRQIRALEVLLATEKSLAYWQEIPRDKPYPNANFEYEYIDIPRSDLYERCNARFIKMLDEGGLEEVKKLHEMKISENMPAMRAVGVPEIIAYLNEEYNLETAIAKAQQATRNYAKRQITWFRHQLKML